MADSSEVHALEKITSEVDESQIKVILSTQCMKAQAFLADKLKKQANHLKETCGYINAANQKLQSEIAQAELKLESMLLAQSTIKLANVELKKQLLVAKERKIDVIDRKEIGENKYEQLWEEAKQRYESIQFVQELLKAKEKEESIKKEIDKHENVALTLVAQIETKTKECLDLDRKRIIELADFIVNEMPKIKAVVMEKTKAIRELKEEMKQFEVTAFIEPSKASDNGNDTKGIEIKEAKDSNGEWSEDMGDSFMPKLKLQSLDFDILSMKLDQVNIKRANSLKLESMNVDNNEYTNNFETDFEQPNVDQNKNYAVSPYFNEPSIINITEERQIENYSKKKLINILEDVKLDKNDTFNIISKVNIDYLNPVNSIAAECANDVVESQDATINKNAKAKNTKPIENEEIEEIDRTDENILNPPTQFLDMTLIIQGNTMEEDQEQEKIDNSSELNNTPQSQKENLLKKVSFDLPTIEETEIANTNEHNNAECIENNVGNVTANSQLDTSVVSDDGFTKIRDMVLRKHNLDLSPQFVYTKNTHVPMIIEEKPVTSKFFQREIECNSNNENNVLQNVDNIQPHEATTDEAKEFENDIVKSPAVKKVVEVNIDEAGVSSPKRPKLMESSQTDRPISGFLFSHGAQAIPESLDVSISTTGFDDGDNDNEYPHCIDSSLLLSPKADIPLPASGDNPEGLSQEVPNFLTGLRKTGLSFFGRLSSDTKPDSSAPNQGGGFSFNFGGEDKKSRGGLFSMFK